MKKSDLFSEIVPFIRSIGLEVSEISLNRETFIPGIKIENGELFYDSNILEFPGDLLHEAGHLAVMLPEERRQASGNLEPGKSKKSSLELGVICWTYAALVHLNLPLEVVFHPKGYRGNSDWYKQRFLAGDYIGLPLLQWMGLCTGDREEGTPEFPRMIKWLREG